MGDRAVAGFRGAQDAPTIYLYQHWDGEGQAERMADAVDAARPRWSDPDYATRIAVSSLVGPAADAETGYGLYAGGTRHGADYDHVLVADWAAREVLVCSNDDSDAVFGRVGFEDLIADPRGAVRRVLAGLDSLVV